MIWLPLSCLSYILYVTVFSIRKEQNSEALQLILNLCLDFFLSDKCVKPSKTENLPAVYTAGLF